MRIAKTLHIIIFLLIPLIGFSQNYSEYTIKAVLIEKITRFIDWPSDSKFNNVNKPVIISVIGDNPFRDILDNIYSYQTINNKNVQVRYISSIDQIKNSDILFICVTESNKLEEILEYTSNKPILTFGETQGYAKKGVHINFFIKNSTVHFEVNESAVRKSRLYISFRLLNQAVIVNPLN